MVLADAAHYGEVAMRTMLSKSRVVSLGAALAVTLAATAAASQAHLYGSPPGSYLNSCTDVINTGTQLRARCKTHDERWIPAQLQHLLFCVSDISTDDGVLVCTRDRTMNGGPVGSYEKTCRDIHRVEGQLYATCRRRLGEWVPTSINATCMGEISNEDGALTCNPAP